MEMSTPDGTLLLKGAKTKPSVSTNAPTDGRRVVKISLV